MRRLARLRQRMATEGVGAALIWNPVNVGYVSGFTGSTAALLVTAERAVFITDSRYAVQAGQECEGFELQVTPSSGTYAEKIAEQIKELGVPQVAFEAEWVTVGALEGLAKKLEGVELKPVSELAAALRRVKDAEEIRRIRAACELADRAFDHILTFLRPGISERDVAIELEYWMKKQGAEKEAFDTIVASGHRSAMPHGRASEKRLETGDFITMDFGARLESYNSDLTRTVVLGHANDKQREVYSVVLDANRSAIAAIRPGLEGKAVDEVARQLITQRGYGQNFGHGLGHGLGLLVHDHLAYSTTSTVKLEAGMVTTIEPGVYIDGWGGVRVEDDVLITEVGCEVLTRAPKELIEVA
jgi:Xaa-Pro aminopeptidase